MRDDATTRPHDVANSPPTIGSILVPLDGSALAERAVPVATHVAHATGARLVLAHVISSLTRPFAFEAGPASWQSYEELLAIEDRAASAYLQRLLDALPPELRAESAPVRGDPSSALIELVEKRGVDLVVMTTHGYTGLRRFALGSVADRVARWGAAPVLLLRSFGPLSNVSDDELQLERVLIPLDGSALAEAALEMATPLVGSLIRHVTLLRVVALAASAPAKTRESEDEVLAAQRYLQTLRERLLRTWQGQQRDNCTISVRITHGEPGAQIVAEAARSRAMLVMATRGHTGWTRWQLGSVADRVLEGTQSSLLLINPQAAHRLPEHRRIGAGATPATHGASGDMLGAPGMPHTPDQHNAPGVRGGESGDGANDGDHAPAM